MRPAPVTDPGIPVPRHAFRPHAPGPLAAILVLCLLCAMAVPAPARADGLSGPAPEAPPPPRELGEEDDDGPRRDVRMGTRDNMSMGRDKEGNLVMEIAPRPRPDQNDNQPPVYIYPQVYPGYGGTGAQAGQGQAGQGQTTPPGIQGQVAGPGGTPVGQSPPPMVYPPGGPPGGMPPPQGQGGSPGGQTPPPMVSSPRGGPPMGQVPPGMGSSPTRGPQGTIPAPPGPGRGGVSGQ